MKMLTKFKMLSFLMTLSIHGSTGSSDDYQHPADTKRHLPTSNASTEEGSLEDWDEQDLIKAATQSLEEDRRNEERRRGIEREKNGQLIERD
jgi:hypothetical protein